MFPADRPHPVDALRNLLRAGQNYRQVMASANDVGITETHALTCLKVLGRQSQTSLAANLGLTAAATTSVVDRLESAGLARRTEDPADRRRWMIELDSRGSELLDRSRERLAEAFATIPTERWDEVTTLLGTIADGVDRAAVRLAEDGV